MIDLIAKAVALFKAQTALATLTGLRIYDTELPRGFSTSPEAPKAIVISQAPNSDYLTESPIAEVALELYCYGENPTQARIVERAVYDALHAKQNLTAGGTRWIATWIDQPGQPKVHAGERETKWDFVLMQVRAIVATA